MKKFLSGLFATAAFLLGSAYYLYLNTARIVIFHTNDMHGWIMPSLDSKSSSSLKTGLSDDVIMSQKEVGGFAVLSNLLKKTGRNRLLLDSGDFFQGTPEGDLSKGNSVIECMNLLGYTASTIGNHEYDLGEENIKRLSQIAKFSFLACNIYDEKSKIRVPYVQPYLIKEIDGVKVACVGVTTSLMHMLTLRKNVEHLFFQRETDALKEVMEELKKKGVKVVIVLAHIGIETKDSPKDLEGEKFLAANVPGIHLILGGHSHFPLHQPYQDEKNKTLIVHNQWGLKTVSRTVLRVWKNDGKVFYSTSKLIPLNVKKYGEDPQIKKIVESYQEKMGKSLGEVIGEAKIEMDRKGPETILGNWQTDVMRQYAKSDFAFQNIGGIRADLPKGILTLRHLYLLSPFENTIVTMELPGKQVKDILEHSVSGPQGILQVSGLKMVYDLSQPKGEMVKEILMNGKPIDLKKNYTIVTNNFLADGGDGFITFKEGKNIKDDYVSLRNVQVEYVKKHSPISAQIEGRIIKK